MSARDVEERRVRVAVVASAVLVAVVAALVALYGVYRPPAFASLVEQPDPAIPGTIAWVSAQGVTEEGPCVSAVEARGGHPEEVGCVDRGIDWIDRLAWSRDGEIVAIGLTRYPRDEPAAVVIDRAGDLVERGTVNLDALGDDRHRHVGPDGALVHTGGGPNAAQVQVRDLDGNVWTAVSVEAPPRYRFDRVRWSPDGAWLVIADSESRLLIAAAREGAEPRVLAESTPGVGAPPWHGLAWFVAGEEHGTVTVDVGG